MYTEQKKVVQRTTSSRLWEKARPVFVFGCSLALGVLAGKFVGGSLGFSVGAVTTATAIILLTAGLLWIEARTTGKRDLMQEFRSVKWFQLTARLWLVAALLLGTPVLVNAVLGRFLDESIMKLLMVLEALIVYLLVSRYSDVLGTWIVQKATSPDEG